MYLDSNTSYKKSMRCLQRIYAFYVKRVLDIIFSVIIFFIALIPMIIISIGIFINDGYPIIFKQERIGKNGKRFKIYKFRTMIKNAEDIGPKSTLNNDNRITKFGSFLRTTSLDELPQVINVLKGNMSLIGFRPDVPRENVDFTQYKWRLKPGITGYAQVNGRSNLKIDELRMWENQYTKDISLLTDCKILLKTIKVVINGEGVN